MNPDEVIKHLEELGVKRDKKTPQRYTKNKLVPEPTRINLGRGKGNIVDYPDSTPYEFYGSLFLKQFEKVSDQELSEARRLALAIKQELSDDERLVNRGKDIAKELEEDVGSSFPQLEKNPFGEGDYSDEVRYSFKERISELTQNAHLAELAIRWFYLSRAEEGKAKEMIERSVKRRMNQ